MAMRPDFALNLSFDGITLLQRVKGGWARLGQAGLDGDLGAEMAALRTQMSEAGQPEGVVKLILPEDQIKLLERDIPKGASLDAAARDALDGQTPYAVAELRIDALERDGRLHVAAVAVETLEEAEAFALGHGFSPMGFVAAQGNGFGREVCFGAAESWSGKALKPDSTPLRIVPMPEPEPEPEEDTASAATAEKARITPSETADPAPTTASDSAEAPADHKSDAQPEEPAPEPPAEAAAEADASDEAEVGMLEPAAEESDASPSEPSVPSEAKPYPVRARAADPLADPKSAPPLKAPAAAPTSSEAEDPSTPPEEKPAFVSMRARRDTPPPAPKTPAAPLRARDDSPSGAPRLSVRPVAADRIDSPVAPDPQVLDSLTRPAPPVLPDDSDLPSGPFGKAALDQAARDKPAPDKTAQDKTAPRDMARPIGHDQFEAAHIPNDPAPLQPGDASVTAPVGTAVDSPALAASSARLGSAGLRPGAAAGSAPVAEARRGLGARIGLGGKDAKAKAAHAANGAQATTASANEAERMTVFGARRKDNYVGGKPRFLGLMLTSALLLFLLGVAAWASVFLEDGLARLFRSPTPSEIAVVPEDPLPEVVAPAKDPAPLSEQATDTSLSAPAAAPAPEPQRQASLAVEPVAPAPSEPVAQSPDPVIAAPQSERPPEALSTEEAEATYAATGIWQRAPEAPVDIRESGAGDVYVASIDPDVPQFDANALPMARVARDPSYDAPPIPAPAGTIFNLDDRGLVRATPEGAVNPDRVRIFAGLPPAVPPLRGDALAPVVEAIPERADGSRPAPTEIFQRLQEFDDFRPNTRPGDLQEQNDRANLTGFSRNELAAFRPALRPDAEKTAQEEDVTATDQAVAVSERPSSRPVNMARIVAAAQERQAASPAPTTQVASAAAVAPRTVAPSIPSNTSVARAATEENALNLRRINLIGVYGQPSSRSALVRLSNGRYVKVSVGDRLDGGRVAAIGESQLRYVKGGRNMTLEMPRG